MGIQADRYTVAGYSFEGTGLDITGVNPITLTGATYDVGLFGKCLKMDGVDDRGLIADNASLSFTDGINDKPFSISFWIKFNSITSRQWIVSKRDITLTNANEYQVILYEGGFGGNKISFYLFKYDPSAYLWSQTNASLTAGVWTHVCCTYDGSKTYAGMKIYFNTVLQATTNKSTGGYTGMTNTNSPVSVGYLKGVPSTFFGGLIDLLKIRNKELTQSEIQRDYLNLPIF